jgi:CcmD family protein
MKSRSVFIIFFVTIHFIAFPIKFQKPGGTPAQTGKWENILAMTAYPELYADEKTEKSSGTPETVVQEEKPAESGKLFKVMMVVMIIWLGLALYLFRLDKKITKLENDVNEL